MLFYIAQNNCYVTHEAGDNKRLKQQMETKVLRQSSKDTNEKEDSNVKIKDI